VVVKDSINPLLHYHRKCFCSKIARSTRVESATHARLIRSKQQLRPVILRHGNT